MLLSKTGAKVTDLSKCSILSRTEIQQPEQLPKLITFKSLIVCGRVNSHRKAEKVLYNFGM
jgi:hypothetical protein